jgi:hypothetical protein
MTEHGGGLLDLLDEAFEEGDFLVEGFFPCGREAEPGPRDGDGGVTVPGGASGLLSLKAPILRAVGDALPFPACSCSLA